MRPHPRRGDASHLLRTWPWFVVLAGLLGACTGTQEARTPMVLLVAGTTASGSVLDVYATGLPPDPQAPASRVAYLPSFQQTLAGTIVTVTHPADEASSLRHVVHRDGDRDFVTTFDVANLDLAVPTSLVTTGAPIDLGARVADAAVFPDARTLCTVEAVASRDGRWLGVLHDGSACRSEASVPAVLLIELTPAVGASPRVLPAVTSTNDAPAAPRIVTIDGRASLAWLTQGATAAVRSISLDAPEDPAITLAELAAPFDDAVALETFDDAIVVASDDELEFVDLSDDEAAFGPRWSRPSTLPAFTGLRSARSLPGTAVLGVTSRGVALYLSVARIQTDEEPIVRTVSDVVDAFIDPYGYAFVLSSSRITTLDAFNALQSVDVKTSSSLAPGVSIVAGTWAFAQDTGDGVTP